LKKTEYRNTQFDPQVERRCSVHFLSFEVILFNVVDDMQVFPEERAAFPTSPCPQNKLAIQVA
jgi:hypothetical protein